MATIEIFTDGGCRPNPGRGAWAAILRSKSVTKEFVGTHPETSNNRMELTAAIEGLRAITKPDQIVEVYTDSQYVRDGITRFLEGWKSRNWRKADRKPVANVDLWMELDLLCQKHKVSWNWLRGHAGHPMNERADALCTEAINQMGGERVI